MGGSAVTISSASSNARSAISPLGELSVLLATGAANTDEVRLLMRAGQFSPGKSLIMQAYDRQYSLQTIALLQQSADLILPAFTYRL